MLASVKASLTVYPPLTGTSAAASPPMSPRLRSVVGVVVEVLLAPLRTDDDVDARFGPRRLHAVLAEVALYVTGHHGLIGGAGLVVRRGDVFVAAGVTPPVCQMFHGTHVGSLPSTTDRQTMPSVGSFTTSSALAMFAVLV